MATIELVSVLLNFQLRLGVDESYTLMVSKKNEQSIVGEAIIKV